ncbi:MAG TPA: MFS transporter [Desulfomonilaceae bacterium]|nr:MFS transporter [Desulfomonilaceae bacterium]
MSEDRSELISAWSPLHQAVFRSLWLAAIVSNIGTWMQNVAGLWLMTSLTSSPVMVALMQTATSLPVFLVVLPSAALADIIDRKRMLLFTQGWMCVAAAGLSALTFMGTTTPWALLAFTFALGLGSAMNMPIWQAIIPGLVRRSELPAAVALNSVAFNIARAVGPALGGAVVAAAGPGPVFLLNAASFIGVIAVVYRWENSAPKNSLPAEHMIAAIKTGARYTLHAPALQAVLVRCLAFIVCSSSLWALMPLMARHELGLGSVGFGWLFGCIGTGALLGAALLPRFRKAASTDQLVNAASVVLAVVILLLALIRNIEILYVAMVAAGIAWMTAMSNLTVSAQTSTPSWVQARALGFYTLAFQGGMAISSVMWGAIAERGGNSFSLSCASIALMLGLVFSLKWRLGAISDLDLRPSSHWPDPDLMVEPEPDEGPVYVALEYRIDPSNADKFVKAVHDLSRIRRRDGAVQWSLFRDLGDSGRYIEIFKVESWAEHLRQHSRVTVSDRAAERRVRAFHIGDKPPVVSHFISQQNTSGIS